jgi:hypothetical protein
MDLPQIIPGQPGISVLIWLIIFVVVLYASRTPAHKAFATFGKMMKEAFGMTATSLIKAEEHLQERNRQVLFEQGKDAAERLIEREFERMEKVINRDFAKFPSMYQRLNQHLVHMEEDYNTSAEVPPAPDAWVRAIDAVASIPPTGDSMVADVLGNIKDSMTKAQKAAIDEYREVVHERHQVLKKMLPSWRKVSKELVEMKKSMDKLEERSHDIDKQLDKFDQIHQKSHLAERMLASSSYTQFFISTFVLAIAIGGAIINFQLIAYPMQEMVGGSSYIGSFKTSDVAAMVIILVELSMGLFLMEAMHFTRLFPVIGMLDERMLIRMRWITFTLLFILATVESSLAYMRELLVEQNQAISRSLTQGVSDVQIVEEAQSLTWIPTVGQMIMGFILPFALTFVAIPLESFVHSSRNVFGLGLVLFIRFLAYLMNLLGSVLNNLSTGIIHIYDIVIFIPLWIEAKVGKKAKAST